MSDVDRFIGVPYKLGHSSFRHADCWGLVRLWFLEERNVELPPLNERLAGERVPPKRFVREALEREVERAWDSVDVEQARAGDVVQLRYTPHREHCGLVVPDGRILTTNEAIGSHLADWGPRSFWGMRVLGVWRWRDAEAG